MCLPTALALPLHSYGDVGSPVIGSSSRCYKSIVTIKSPHSDSRRQQQQWTPAASFDHLVGQQLNGAGDVDGYSPAKNALPPSDHHT